MFIKLFLLKIRNILFIYIFRIHNILVKQITVDEYVSSHEINQNVHHIHTRLWNYLFYIILVYI